MLHMTAERLVVGALEEVLSDLCHLYLPTELRHISSESASAQWTSIVECVVREQQLPKNGWHLTLGIGLCLPPAK